MSRTSGMTFSEAASFVWGVDQCLRYLLGFGLDDLHPKVAQRLIDELPAPFVLESHRRVCFQADDLLAEHGEEIAGMVVQIKACSAMQVMLRAVGRVFIDLWDLVSDDQRSAASAAVERLGAAIEALEQRCSIEPRKPTLKVIQGGKE